MKQTIEIATVIEEEAQYHDGMITFPAYLFEQLKQELGMEFIPSYLETK